MNTLLFCNAENTESDVHRPVCHLLMIKVDVFASCCVLISTVALLSFASDLKHVLDVVDIKIHHELVVNAIAGQLQ